MPVNCPIRRSEGSGGSSQQAATLITSLDVPPIHKMVQRPVHKKESNG